MRWFHQGPLLSQTGDEAGRVREKAIPVLSSSRRHRASFVLGGSTVSPSVRGHADRLGGATAPAQSVEG